MNTVPPVSNTRAELTARIDALAASGHDVDMLRADLDRLSLPDDQVSVVLTYSDSIVGGAQIKTLARLFADRIPPDSRALLERIADAMLRVGSK